MTIRQIVERTVGPVRDIFLVDKDTPLPGPPGGHQENNATLWEKTAWAEDLGDGTRLRYSVRYYQHEDEVYIRSGSLVLGRIERV